MANPRDTKLYESIKREYQKTMPNSAYRSGLIVKAYKKAYFKKHGKYNAYVGRRKNPKVGLTRWFSEEWRNESGKIGYDKNNTIYRPTKIISNKTPKTWSELSRRDILKAKREKKRTGRIKSF